MIILDRVYWKEEERNPAEETKEDVPAKKIVTVFDTGDEVVMKSENKLTKEQQKQLEEILFRIWEKFTDEEKRALISQKCAE